MRKPDYIILCAVYGAALMLWPSGLKALDLTPQFVNRPAAEGPPTPTPSILFKDGKRKIIYTPPRKWLVNGSEKSVSITSSDGSQAWMKIINVPKPKLEPQPDGTPAQEDLQAWVAQFIPVGSKEVTFEKSLPSPFTLESHPSTEFIFSFSRYGSRDSISISVVDYNEKERIVTIISSSAKDFEQVRRLGIASLFSWEEAPEKL